MGWIRDGGVLCVGEALVALTPDRRTRLQDAEQLQVGVAGAELNVAVHLARLGLAVRFAGRVGDDPLGRRLRATLVAEGVDVGPLALDPTRPTGLYLKDPGGTARGGDTPVYYYRRGSAGAALAGVPPEAYAGIGHVHLSGVTPALSDGCHQTVRAILDRQRTVSVSFDVNHRPGLWLSALAAPVLADLARRADLVFVGLDEAARLWGTATPEAVRRLLPEPAELVVKDGPRPAVALPAGGSPVVVPAPQVEVVEPVGAGDAFAAGYLAARLGGGAIEPALRLGHALAGEVLRVIGDVGPPPDLDLVAAVLGASRPVPHRSGPTGPEPGPA